MHRPRVLSSALGLSALALIAPPVGSQCASLQLGASDPGKGDIYGAAVAIHGTHVVVGAPRDDPNGLDSGSVYVHDISPGGSTVKLAPSDGVLLDEFGAAVAVWDSAVAVGMAHDDAACPTFVSCNSGSVRVYRESSGAWLPEQVVTGNDTREADRFGTDVALEGDTLFVGAPGADPLCMEDLLCNSGAVYVFERAGGIWIQRQKLVPDDAAPGDWFGTSVALDGDRAVIGAYFSSQDEPLGGLAYVFERVGGVWSQTGRLSPSVPTAHAQFGRDVDVDGDVVVVGAPEFTRNGFKEGAANVFELVDGEWVESGSLFNQAPGILDAFGTSVAVSGQNVFVAAIGADGAAEDSGSTLLYVRTVDGWTHDGNLASPQGLTSDEYGSALAVDGEFVLVGARLADAPLVNTGAAFLHGVPQGVALTACTNTVSVSAGGSQELHLQAGYDLAGEFYVLLGSASGTAPGVALGEHHLPLVPDAYTDLVLANPNVPPLESSFGVLDYQGSAEAAFVLPHGSSPALAGLVLDHAFLVLDVSAGAVSAVSNARSVALTP